MLSAHYRSPLNFSADLMEASKNGLERILTGMEKLREAEAKAAGGTMTAEELENQKSYLMAENEKDIEKLRKTV